MSNKVKLADVSESEPDESSEVDASSEVDEREGDSDSEMEKKKKGKTKKRSRSKSRSKKSPAKKKSKSSPERKAKKKSPERTTKKKSPDRKGKKPLLNQVDTDIDNIEYKCEKLTSDGKCCNFKIVSWNVAGIRAWVKKNGHKYVKKEQPDILCLQEVKCSEKKLPSEVKIEGYHAYWSVGLKEGYAGVGMYTKEEPLDVKYGIGMPELDSEGRVIIAEFPKFYLVCVYVPNAGAGLKNLKKRMDWDVKFRKRLKSYDNDKPVIIAGDMNVSHQPIDLANPKTNTKSAGFTQEERDGMTALLESGFVDTFRYLYPTKERAYTYWTYLGNARSRNTGWRLDYFVMSGRYIKHLCDNVIRSTVYGSDHCPIILYLHV